MTEFRVLVADKVKAQLYELPSSRSALKSLQCFVNPAGQQPERALGTSRPGRVTSGTSGVRHAYQPKHGLKEHAEEVFVRQIASALAKDARANGGGPIVLVAAPRLLGVYRQHLPAAVRKRVVLEVKLDLAKLPAKELTRRVREAIKTLPLAVTERVAAPRRKSTV
jgi:protein required for attachment to host cells